MEISSGVNLAWQIGCQEAVIAKKELCDPIQYFCGITKVAEIATQPQLAAEVFVGIQVNDLNSELDRALATFWNDQIDLSALRHLLRERAGYGAHNHLQGEIVHRSESLRAIFQSASNIAEQEGSLETIKLHHIQIAILENKDLMVSRVLLEQGFNLDSLVSRIKSGEKPQSYTPAGEKGKVVESRTGKTPLLERYGRDLTALARKGKLGPVVGRRKEALQLVQALARRSKNNPVLVGEPGVGKTAIAELLAIRIADGKDPQVLGGKRLIELTMSGLMAGAGTLGEREERLEGIISESRDNPDVILFVDELHTLIKAGGVSGVIDPADIFKPALARGEIRCIGATTLEEYARYIESDAALERRFEKVIVTEPSAEETLQILQGLRPKLEKHHSTEIPDEALKAAIELSVRFDGNHQLPDKAIDLIDKAGAYSQVPQLSMYISEEALSEKNVVPKTTVARVLSEKLGVPLDLIIGHLEDDPKSRLMQLEAYLNESVLGQEEAAKRISERLILAHTGLGDRRGPLAVFQFLGTTGIGKTEMARALTTFLFGDERAMIRIDMSEYMEEHSVAKLIGSPPGYIGHDEEGQLTGQLRAHPYSIVLLDEVDKAHPRVMDLFLQVFDDGRLTDAKGRTADAQHAIFVLTSNTQTNQPRVGFTPSSLHINDGPDLEANKGLFRPELLNRIDEQIVFKPLDMDNIKKLVRIRVDTICKNFHERYGKSLSIDGYVIAHLSEAGFSKEYGVRELKRTIEKELESPLGRLLVSGEASNWSGIAVLLKENEIAFDHIEGEK